VYYKGVPKNFEQFQTSSFSAKLEKYIKICGKANLLKKLDVLCGENSTICTNTLFKYDFPNPPQKQ
jgi:hypothetical protein